MNFFEQDDVVDKFLTEDCFCLIVCSIRLAGLVLSDFVRVCRFDVLDAPLACFLRFLL